MEGGGPRSLVDRGFLAGLAAVLTLEVLGVLVQVVTGRPVPEVTFPATAFALACVLRDHGLRRTMSFVALVVVIPFGSEFLGVLTGYPYGPYAYLSLSGPWVFGLVPVFILVAWLNITFLAMATTTLALGRSRLWLAFVDGAVAVSWDAMVDPLAVHAGYWTWFAPGGLYGVPLTNFLGWFLVVTLLSMAVRSVWARDATAPDRTSRLAASIVPMLLLGSGVAFATLAVHEGFLVSATIGLGVIVPVVVLAWTRVARMPSGVRAPNPWGIAARVPGSVPNADDQV